MILFTSRRNFPCVLYVKLRGREKSGFPRHHSFPGSRSWEWWGECTSEVNYPSMLAHKILFLLIGKWHRSSDVRKPISARKYNVSNARIVITILTFETTSLVVCFGCIEIRYSNELWNLMHWEYGFLLEVWFADAVKCAMTFGWCTHNIKVL